MYLWENFYSTTAPEDFAAMPEMRFVPRSMVDGWVRQKGGQPTVPAEVASGIAELRLSILRKLHEAGAPVLMGTDAPQMFNVPGFSLHHEMGVMEQVMSPFDVIETGTRNVSDYVEQSLGLDAAFGTVAEGNWADLLLVESNPLETTANLSDRAGVFVRGRWLPEEDIQRRLASMADKYAN
jgi:imidazolonepropionase-like amidohydrolase